MALIELDEISKIYQMGQIEVHALRGVSLQVEPGEMLAIMGGLMNVYEYDEYPWLKPEKEFIKSPRSLVDSFCLSYNRIIIGMVRIYNKVDIVIT